MNSASTIEKCINSVLSQAYNNIEYIVVDGWSKDGTLKIIKKFKKRIDYFVSEPDSGLYCAMNKGLSLANGDYILLLNSDDWYTENCVQTLIDTQKEKQVDIVSALADYVDGNESHQFTTQPIPLDKTTHIRNPLRHETMLVPAWVYNKFGPYDESYRVIADFHFIIKLHEAGIKHYTLDKPLMGFRNTGVSSTDMSALFKERMRILKEQFPYVNDSDIDILCNLAELKQSDVEGILRRNRMYHKFHAALLAFARGRWRFDDGFLDNHNTDSFKKDYLRIETFTTNAGGGAGIGSQRRIEALSTIGIDVGLNALFASNSSVTFNKLTRSRDNGREIQPIELVSNNCFVIRKNTPGFNAEEMFSSHQSVLRMADISLEINRADVLHFHWMSGILDYENFDLIANKPIVWTLADMAAFTGGCHYSEGCEGYKKDCSNCDLVGPNKEIVNKTWETKKRAYEKLNNLTIICPSQWLADRAAESTLLKQFPIKMIPNPVPLSRFFPTNKIVARIKLGLDLNKRYILFGADNLTSKRKGGAQLAEALKILQSKKAKNIEILTFGEDKIDLPFPQVKMGYCSDDDKMRLIYSAADVFAFPSKEDNSPLTVSEAMACGTVVVSFPVGNIPELVQHKNNGYIAKTGDIEDFSTGLEWHLEGSAIEKVKRSLSATSSLRKNNDPLKSAHEHAKLYSEVTRPDHNNLRAPK